MTLGDFQRKFTFNIHLLIQFAYSQGYELTFGEAYRTQYQQEQYFKEHKTEILHSNHLNRLAIDFNLFKDGQLLITPFDFLPLGNYWMSLNTNNRWGGDWNRDYSLLNENFLDPYHFEMMPSSI